MGHGYILITPVRNERDQIDQLIRAVTEQSLRPAYWILAIDSNSTDGTYDYLMERSSGYDWIKIVKSSSEASEGYSHKNFARTVNAALEQAFALDKGIEFIGKTDAEVRLDPRYFEFLLGEMEKDERFAICCGVQRFEIDGNDYVIKEGSEDPLVGFNDIRLYRRSYLEEMGGYPISYQPDTVLLIKAVNRGFLTKVFPDVSFIKRRQGASKMGLWKGNVMRGKGLYAMGYTPVYALLYSLYYSRFPPHYQCFALTFGYLSGMVRREDQIDDQEVLAYISHRSLLKTVGSVMTKKKVEQ